MSLRREQSHCRPRQPRGFTLIELMVAMVVLAIIAAVAYPSYVSSMRKSKRADAMAAVAAVQQAQERWRANNTAYSLNLAGELKVSEPALYSLSLSAPAAPASISTGYVLVAEARGAQAADTECKRMSVRLVDGQLSYASCESCGSFSYAATDKCWRR